MKNCLILMAHGSRDSRWREPFERLATSLKNDLGEDEVWLAYMEFVQPTLQEVVGQSVAKGVREIRVLPLFMSAGGHVARDIPNQVATVRKKHPDLAIEILSPIGEDPRFIELVKRIAKESVS